MADTLPPTYYDQFSVSEGDCLLRWPKHLTAEDVADVLDWLELVRKRISRQAAAHPEQERKP